MDLREAQINLETQWLDIGADTFKATLSNSPFSSTSIGSYLLGKCAKDTEDAIKDYLKDVTFKNLVHKAIWLLLSPQEISTIALRCLLDVAFSQHPGFDDRAHSSNCVSSISIKLGTLLVNQFNYLVFRAKNPRGYDYMTTFLRDKPRNYRYRTLRWWKQVCSHTDLVVPTDDRASLGYPILRIVLETTGLFEIIPRTVGNKRVSALFPSRELMTTVLEQVDTLSYMHPLHLPMVCPPEPWTDVNKGGYLTLGDTVITHCPKAAKELQLSGHLQSRYDILNRLGSTPWEINKDLIDIMEEAYRINHPATPLADLGVEIPPKPWSSSAEYLWLTQEKPEVIQKWKKDTAVIYTKFFQSRMVGQRMSFLRTLSIAKRFSRFDTIWFPYRIDYRGRFYPLPTTLQPQGDDVAKALLRFKQQSPLSPGDPEAWRWYLIQGANMMGVDKVPLDERVSYIRKHHVDIIHSAESPLTAEWWTQADKPWCMLAWCKEYTLIVKHGQRYTQLPVGLDGRCNGLQHLSAAVRDEVTGNLVSLVPREEPTDIYTLVLDAVEAALPEDSVWKGNVTRKLVKRNTMTTPYNVTINGMGNQIKEEMLSASSDFRLTAEDLLRATELREYNHKCIISLLGKTAELMQWYNVVAREYMRRKLRISWTLPDGFRVIQDIPKMVTKKVRLSNRTVVVNYRQPLLHQDARRNTSAFSPNVTHSMDATHMAMFIRKLPADVPFSAIHDSFGLPATYVPQYGGAIVETFCDLYQEFDIVGEIQRDFYQKTGEQLPPPPQRGNLDLAEVRRSVYAFA